MVHWRREIYQLLKAMRAHNALFENGGVKWTAHQLLRREHDGSYFKRVRNFL